MGVGVLMTVMSLPMTGCMTIAQLGAPLDSRPLKVFCGTKAYGEVIFAMGDTHHPMFYVFALLFDSLPSLVADVILLPHTIMRDRATLRRVPSIAAQMSSSNAVEASEARMIILALEGNAAPALVALLDSDNTQLILEAVRVLEAIGPEARDATPALITLVTHNDITIRNTAIIALGTIGARTDAVPPILNVIARSGPMPDTANAAYAIEQIRR